MAERSSECQRSFDMRLRYYTLGQSSVFFLTQRPRVDWQEIAIFIIHARMRLHIFGYATSALVDMKYLYRANNLR